MSVKKQLKSSIPLVKVEKQEDKQILQSDDYKATKDVKAIKSEASIKEVAEKSIAPRRSKKACQFCFNKTEPKYWDVSALRRFMTDRGRIAGRSRYGTCAKHQRRISQEIKRARHLALLPFTVKV